MKFFLFLIVSISSIASAFAIDEGKKIYLDKNSVQLLHNKIVVTTKNGPMTANALHADKYGLFVISLKPFKSKSYCSTHGHYKNNNRNHDCDRCERERERPWEKEVR